jgi:hypothetical protein
VSRLAYWLRSEVALKVLTCAETLTLALLFARTIAIACDDLSALRRHTGGAYREPADERPAGFQAEDLCHSAQRFSLWAQLVYVHRMRSPGRSEES